MTYDIGVPDAAGQRRLAVVAKVCEGFGLRTQYSVFECRLTEAAYERLLGQLLAVIDPAQDTIHIYRFPGDLTASRTTLGVARAADIGTVWRV